MNNSHLQRLEKLVSQELSHLYSHLSDSKSDIKHYWEKAIPNDPTGLMYFRDLNDIKVGYRRILQRIKSLEETQRAIRKILRK